MNIFEIRIAFKEAKRQKRKMIATMLVTLGVDRAGLVVAAAAAAGGGGTATSPDAGGGGDQPIGKKGWWSDRRGRLPSAPGEATAGGDSDSSSSSQITRANTALTPDLVPMGAAAENSKPSRLI